MTKENLEKLNKKWKKGCKCGLRKTATQAVFGDGNAHADIVFIGEAPGKSEDKAGKPFVGSAGKFLSEMLSTIQLQREDVYITNIVKYRPPNNRDPLPLEKSTCKSWLLEELKIINPKLIILLGRHALNTFFPDEKISTKHGKVLIKNIKEVPIKYFLVLYHPASLFYNPSIKKIFLKDFKKIPKILKEINNKL